MNGQSKRVHGTLKPLEHVNAEQLDQALFAIDLPPVAPATRHFGAVLAVVGLLLVSKNIPERRVGREVQPTDLLVEFTDGAKLSRGVNVGLDVDRLAPVGKAAGPYGV